MNTLATPAIAAATEAAKISMIGSRAFLVEAPGAFDLPAQRRIWALAQALEAQPDVQELVPGMTNLLVLLKATPADPQAVLTRLRDAWAASAELDRPGRLIEIPVHYGGKMGADLPAICDFSGLPAAEVIARHHARTYTVFALGSAPGFGYLHGLDPAIFMPRKKVPSLNMPKGTVTIGGMQAGVSVLTGPNGWNALGYAEIEVFDPHAAHPALMAPGDTVRFLPERIEL
ncbi:5-oxoprolinase subunit PxpB [Paenirhodobacter populi]|uniref:5-oxoprolinase subunit PxpB n=1 Tax=Paenirhodobacter populi TaxID=2306993 RepID=UPI000FE34AED|nr:5-oxoprolinase subunit PxpB [Sinirhodobacter populi]RWR10225.1 5-oxoprolinase subunit PxpB [Sinirhodobacter populi]